jgi:ATP-dependent DNA helicase RecG
MHLASPLISLFRIDATQEKALKRLKLLTVRDLLFYFPVRYSNISEIKLIRDIVPGENATVFGTISGAKTKKGFRSKIPMGEATIEDLSGTLKVIWFNQAYMAKMVHDGESVRLSGKVTQGKQGIYLANPEVEHTPNLPIDSHDSLFANDEKIEVDIRYPIYKETRGVTSKWIFHAVQKMFKSGILETIEDYIPEGILKKYSLPKLSTALVWIHYPKKESDSTAARKRFAFEEVFFIQLHKQQLRAQAEAEHSYTIDVDDEDIADFMSRFPFTPTQGQEKAVSHVLEDFTKGRPMSRLIEGDVGSGKTAVAATAAYAIIKNRPPKKGTADKQTFGNLQIAYMAPTEILATQHFESFIKYFKHTGISVGLITGSGCRKFPSKVASAILPRGAAQGVALAKSWTDISRTQLLKWVANGEIPIVIGTHTLIQKSVEFKHLAMVIIDEQHRFGTLQRSKLAKKESTGWTMMPHLLSMTATPIPRTLALTIYGDLDLTLLDEMPAGRKQIITEIVTPDKRENVYEQVRAQMAEGRQLYVICARINEPDPDQEIALNLKSVTEEAKRLKKDIFPEYTVGILHSKMTKDKKEEVMKDFYAKEIDILVATSVVEVGVNVPNATMIIIEGGERFGLSQLHQLRGRVIRSTHQAYCFVFAESKTQKTMERLKALKTAKNGFELSELDLALRGAGELAGSKQWGLSDLGMEAIKNIKMVEAARTEATKLIEKDKNLKAHPLLSKILSTQGAEIHFE